MYWNRVKPKPKVIHREKGTYPNVIPLPADSNLGIIGKELNAKGLLQKPDTEVEDKPECQIDLTNT